MTHEITLNNGTKKKNVWDFKLRNIKIQAVVVIQFAIIVCLDLL